MRRLVLFVVPLCFVLGLASPAYAHGNGHAGQGNAPVTAGSGQSGTNGNHVNGSVGSCMNGHPASGPQCQNPQPTGCNANNPQGGGCPASGPTGPVCGNGMHVGNPHCSSGSAAGSQQTPAGSPPAQSGSSPGNQTGGSVGSCMNGNPSSGPQCKNPQPTGCNANNPQGGGCPASGPTGPVCGNGMHTGNPHCGATKPAQVNRSASVTTTKVQAPQVQSRQVSRSSVTVSHTVQASSSSVSGTQQITRAPVTTSVSGVTSSGVGATTRTGVTTRASTTVAASGTHASVRHPHRRAARAAGKGVVLGSTQMGQQATHISAAPVRLAPSATHRASAGKPVIQGSFSGAPHSSARSGQSGTLGILPRTGLPGGLPSGAGLPLLGIILALLLIGGGFAVRRAGTLRWPF